MKVKSYQSLIFSGVFLLLLDLTDTLIEHATSCSEENGGYLLFGGLVVLFASAILDSFSFEREKVK